MGRLLRRDEGRTHQLGVPDARDLSLLKTPLARPDYSDHDRAVLGSREPRPCADSRSNGGEGYGYTAGGRSGGAGLQPVEWRGRRSGSMPAQ